MEKKKEKKNRVEKDHKRLRSNHPTSKPPPSPPPPPPRSKGSSALENCVLVLKRILSVWVDLEKCGIDTCFFKESAIYSLSGLELITKISQDEKNNTDINSHLFKQYSNFLEEYERVIDRGPTLSDRNGLINNWYLRKLVTKHTIACRIEIRSLMEKNLAFWTLDELKKLKITAASLVTDPKGKEMWEQLLVKDIGCVPWEPFYNAFIKASGSEELEPQMERFIQHLITRGGTNYVPPNHFSSFLEVFGGIKKALPNATKLYSKPWFHPNACEENLDLLRFYPKGTFLVRFSFKGNSYFAIDVVSAPLIVKTYLIRPTSNGLVFKIDSPHRDSNGSIKISEDETFGKVEDIVNKFSDLLVTPLISDSIGKPYFLGHLMTSEVLEALSSTPTGTFLFHSSKDEGTPILCSCKTKGKDSNADILRVGLQKVDRGYMFIPNNPQLYLDPRASYSVEIYPSLDHFINSHSSFLRYNFDPDRVPLLNISPNLDATATVEFSGPEKVNKGTFLEHKGFICAETNATYPNASQGAKVICDRFHLKIIGERTIFALADGCNWGERPRKAAIQATKASIEYLGSNEVQEKIKTTIDCKDYLTRAVRKAHTSILLGAEGDIWSCGQTTLLLGMLLPVDASFVFPEWALVLVNVGDCKAFICRQDEGIKEITFGNRLNALDPSDSGGRIGPYSEAGDPDLRNLGSYFYPCRGGDLIVAMSDGVYDNLDPSHLGLLPPDLSMQQYQTWQQIPLHIACEVKSIFMCEKLNELIQLLKDSPSDVARSLITYCHDVTTPSRSWMEAHPNDKEPSDYKKYPGKMDHVTAISIKVGASKEEIKTKKKNIFGKNKSKKTTDPLDFSSLAASLMAVNKTVIKSYNSSSNSEILIGPLHDEPQFIDNYRGMGCSVSLFPRDGKSTDDGRVNDPIKDCYSLEITRNRITAVLTSGSTFGKKSLEISKKARQAWMDHMSKHQNELLNTFEVAQAAIDATSAAHKACKDESDISVSLIGGICCRLPNLEKVGDRIWVYVCVDVGNFKSFLWNYKTGILKEITSNNQINDSGILGNAKTDYLKHIKIYTHACEDEENEIILMLSPGIYLNFDPMYQGKRPKDTVTTSHKKWNKLENERSSLRLAEMTTFLKNNAHTNNHENQKVRFKDGSTPDVSPLSKCVLNLVNEVVEKTKIKRQYIEDCNNDALDEDRYPGYLAHATCLAFHLGGNNRVISPDSLLRSLNTMSLSPKKESFTKPEKESTPSKHEKEFHIADETSPRNKDKIKSKNEQKTHNLTKFNSPRKLND